MTSARWDGPATSSQPIRIEARHKDQEIAYVDGATWSALVFRASTSAPVLPCCLIPEPSGPKRPLRFAPPDAGRVADDERNTSLHVAAPTAVRCPSPSCVAILAALARSTVRQLDVSSAQSLDRRGVDPTRRSYEGRGLILSFRALHRWPVERGSIRPGDLARNGKRSR